MEIQSIASANLSSLVKDHLYQYIRGLDQKDNMKLPPENQLGAKLGVSRVTVRRALDELEKEGIIIRIHGRGTFVNPEALKIQVNLMPGEEFTHLIEKCGYKASFEVRDIRRRKPDNKTARLLELDTDEEIYEVEKLYFADHHPAIISIDSFACSLIGVELTKDVMGKKSVFDILHQYGRCFIARDKICMETMNRREMEQSSLCGKDMECDSVLVFYGENYNQDNKLVMLDREYYDTNYVKFSLMRVKNIRRTEI